MTRSNTIVHCSWAATVASLLLAGTANAQAALEEITVTAQKRSESVQDVPIAITAFSANQIESLNLTNMLDIGLVTPGLITDNVIGYAQPFLRGVGSTVTFANADSSVATFVDGYYLSYIGGTMQELYDAERIEVLKGPQATLYGRNATAGAINFVSKTPNADEFEGKISAGFGSDSESELKFYLTGPMSDTLSFSLAGLYRERDSYVDFVGPVPAGLNEDITTDGVRGKLFWQPTDGYSAELSISSMSSDNFEEIVVSVLRGTESYHEGTLLGAPTTFAEDYEVSADTEISSTLDQTMAYLTQEFDFSSGMQLRSLTGYASTETSAGGDLDGSPVPLLDAAVDFDSTQFSQEFQLLSGPDSSVRWLVGASYISVDDEMDPLDNQLPSASAAIGLYSQALTVAEIETDAWALFADATFDVTDQFSVTAGVRFTSEEKTLPEGGTVTFNGVPVPSPLFDCTFAGLTFGVDCGGAALGLPDIPPAFVGAGSTLNGVAQPILGESEDWDETTYKLIAAYAVNGDVNMYLSYSHGFKGGVYNIAGLSAGASNTPVDPETLDSIELGMKGDFLDGRLRVNAAIFDYQLEDAQAQVASPGSSLTLLSSAGDVSMQGGEIELFMLPTDKLTLQAGIAFLDSEYEEFTGYPAPTPSVPGGGTFGAGGNANVIIDVSGGDVVRAPELTANLSATYTTEFMSGTLSATGLWSYIDDHCLESSCRAEISQDSYSVANASVSYLTADKRWNFTLWANNLFDEEYYLVKRGLPSGDLGFRNRPRYGGLRVEFNF